MATVDELIRQLQSGNRDERRKAAIELGKLGDPKALPALLETLNKDDETRDAVVAAIGQIGDLNAIQHLLDAYERRPDLFARRIFDAISEILDRTSPDDNKNRDVYSRVVDRLIQIVQDDSATEDVRIAATEALGKTRDLRATQALIQRLEDPSVKHSARAEAAIALGQIGDISVVPALLKTLDDSGKDTEDDPFELFPVDLGEAVIDAIGEILSRTSPHKNNNREIYSRVVDRLIQVLQNDSATEYARTAAAEVLGKTHDPKAVPALVDALHDNSELIRTAARESLQRFILTHPDAVLRISPDDRHLLGRLIQETEHDELLQEIC